MVAGPISKAINLVVDPFFTTETFDNEKPAPEQKLGARLALVSFLTLVLVLLLLLVFGQFLWNNVLVELVPAVKPAKSVWQIMGLAILIGLLSPCC